MNHHEFQNQRGLAGDTGMSLRTVNALLKEMEQAEYLLKSGKTILSDGTGRILSGSSEGGPAECES